MKILALGLSLVFSELLQPGLVFGEDKEPLMPKAALAITRKLDKDIKDLKAKAIETLDKLKIDYTKKGELDIAVAIQDRIKQLQKEIAGSDDSKELRADLLVGRWQSQDGGNFVFEFTKDGKVSNPWNEPWVYSVKDDVIVVITEGSAGGNDPYRLKIANGIMVGENSGKKPMTLKRVK